MHPIQKSTQDVAAGTADFGYFRVLVGAFFRLLDGRLLSRRRRVCGYIDDPPPSLPETHTPTPNITHQNKK